MTADTLSTTNSPAVEGAHRALARADAGSWLDVLAAALAFARGMVNREV